MKKSLIACAALAACFALPGLAQQQITVVNFGGANANAQKKAFYEPYEKQGNKIVAVEYNGEQAKVKAMVETKKVVYGENIKHAGSKYNYVARLSPAVDLFG